MKTNKQINFKIPVYNACYPLLPYILFIIDLGKNTFVKYSTLNKLYAHIFY